MNRRYNAHKDDNGAWYIRYGERKLARIKPQYDVPGFDVAEQATHITKALIQYQHLGPSDDLLRAVSKQAVENDELKDRLAEADARIAALEETIEDLDLTLEEALGQLRIAYVKEITVG